MKKFCPKCGTPIEKGIFCSDCKELQLDFRQTKIKLCPSKRYFYRGKWTKFKDMRALTKLILDDAIKQKFKLIHGLEAYDNLLEKPGLQKILDVFVDVSGEEYKLPIEVEVTYSPGYTKLGSTYFEGILQLRNASSEVKEYIKNYFVKNAPRKVFVNKVVEKETSVDYFFVNKRHMMPLALKIIRNFGGFIDPNAQLFSHNKLTSKDLFRLNILVIVPDFLAGDAVLVGEDPVLVRKTEKLISGMKLETEKNYTFSYDAKTMNSIKPMKKFKSSISSIHPSIQVLHPETYQEFSAKNPLKLDVKSGQKVVVVEHKGIFYIIK
jgi:NMD protein affecting ribosome stability and mRNA decay